MQVCNCCRNRQFNLGPRALFAPYVELRAEAPCAFAHAQQTEMSGARARGQDVGIDARAVIANSYEQVLGIVDDLDLDCVGAGMRERVLQRLAPDSIDIVRHGGLKEAGTALDDHAESRAAVRRKLFARLSER